MEWDTINDDEAQHWPVKVLMPPERFRQIVTDPSFPGVVHLTYWEAPTSDPTLTHRPNYTDDIVYLWHNHQLLGQLDGDDAWLVGTEIRSAEEEDHAASYARLTWQPDLDDPTSSNVHIVWDRSDDGDNISAYLYTSDDEPPEWLSDAQPGG